MWKPSQYSDEVLAAYRAAQLEHPSVPSTFCHATYLINLASPDPELAAKSRACLTANLSTADGMGAEGLVLHIGSHRGSGFETALPAVAEALVGSLDEVDADPSGCPILLENAAGAGDTVGRSFEELAQVIEAAGGDERLGVCLDTQHLWASGIPFGTVAEADDLDRPDRRHRRHGPAALPAPERLQGRLRRQPGPPRKHRRRHDRGRRARRAARPPGPPGPAGHPRGARRGRRAEDRGRRPRPARCSRPDWPCGPEGPTTGPHRR